MTAAVVRPMRWWDVADVMPLERALFPADPWTGAGFWSELAGVPGTRTYLVAEADGELVGYAGLFFAGDSADVQTIAVRSDRQGRGLGATLLRALTDEAVRRGASSSSSRSAPRTPRHSRSTHGTGSSDWRCGVATTGRARMPSSCGGG